MQTKNVHYLERPDSVIVTENGRKAMVEFPINVNEVEREIEGEIFTEYIAETVYYLPTIAVPNLKERVLANYEAWLEQAMIPEPKETTIEDLVEVIDALTDIIIGE